MSWGALSRLVYPPKCILCGKLLSRDEADLCHLCRKDTHPYPASKIKFSYVAGWKALWYYKDAVRSSILRYKFSGRRRHGAAFGRILGQYLKSDTTLGWDMMTWVPVSRRRKWRRGFDQVALIAEAAAQELGCTARPLIKKIRHVPPQSTLQNEAMRRANVLGAFAVIDPETIRGKRILLLDDIITSGATISECARILLTAGAKEVYCAAIAAAILKEKTR